MVFLLGVATTLLAVHGCRGLRWGTRPTEREPNALAVHHIDLNRADRTELLQVQVLPCFRKWLAEYGFRRKTFPHFAKRAALH
jgi:hypothetical protein